MMGPLPGGGRRSEGGGDGGSEASGRFSGLPISAFATKETMLMTTPPQKAGQNPATENDFTRLPTSMRSSALITNVNRPSVIISSGRERISMIGRRKALKMPRTSAAMSRPRNVCASMPGTIWLATRTPAAVTSQRWRNDLTGSKMENSASKCKLRRGAVTWRDEQRVSYCANAILVRCISLRACFAYGDGILAVLREWESSAMGFQLHRSGSARVQYDNQGDSLLHRRQRNDGESRR